jgi:PAS domain S-box-containing protein
MFFFVLLYSGRRHWLTRRNQVIFSAIPVLTLVLAWTNEVHNLIWSQAEVVAAGGAYILNVEHGPAFWVFAVYAYGLLLTSAVLLSMSALSASHLRKRQATTLLVGMLIPLAGNLLYLARAVPVPHLDWTPIFYSFSGLVMVWGLFRYRLLDLVPIAREKAFESIGDAILVLDSQHRVLDLNASAETLIKLPIGSIIGARLEELLPIEQDALEVVPGSRPTVSEVTVEEGEQALVYRVRRSKLATEGTEPAGTVLVLHDITESKRAADALQQSQAMLVKQNAELNKLTQAIEQSANIVVITSVEGTIEYVNPKFTETTGHTADEVRGQKLSLLKPGERTTAHYGDLWTCILAGREWRGQFHNRRKDGSLYWEQATIAPVTDATGQITHLVAVMEDITARKEAEAALVQQAERLQALNEMRQSILEANQPETVAIAAVGRLHKLLACQRVLALALDTTGTLRLLAAEASTPGLPSVDPDDYLPLMEEHALKRGSILDIPDLASATNPSPLQQALLDQGIGSYVVAPLHFQGELVGMLNLESFAPTAFSEEDITIATEVAASLTLAVRQIQLHAKAEEELAERIEAVRQLRARNEELDAFAHTVAHDLKNPLSTLIAYADLLEDDFSGSDDEILAESVPVIADSGRQMSTIIDELLLMSSVRSIEEIEIQPLDMAEIVSEALLRLRREIRKTGADVIVADTWPRALGHGPWVVEVWVNFVSNALKYGGSPPRVELGPATRDDLYQCTHEAGPAAVGRLPGTGQVIFYVRDNGSGVPPDEQANLFTPFERLHQDRADGHGLGLSIVQRIVHKLGGQTGMTSSRDGSTFYFCLPAARDNGE